MTDRYYTFGDLRLDVRQRVEDIERTTRDALAALDAAQRCLAQSGPGLRSAEIEILSAARGVLTDAQARAVYREVCALWQVRRGEGSETPKGGSR